MSSQNFRLGRAGVLFVWIITCWLSMYGQPGQPRPTFATLSAEATRARDANRLDDAISLYHRALEMNSSWQDGWWSLGTIQYDRDQYAQAAPAFEHLVALAPQNGTAHLMLGLCQYELGENDTALDQLKTARRLGIQNDPQLEKVLMYHESMLLLRQGKFERAIDSLHRLTKSGVSSEDVDLAYGMGVLMMKPSDLPAPGSKDRAVVLHVGHAEAADTTETHESARNLYAQVVKAAPVYPNIHYAYGRFLLAIQEPEQALPEFEQELKNQPGHVRARLQIAAIHYRKDSAAGIPYALEAVKLASSFPFAHYMLGLLYLDTGDAASAIPQLEQAKSMVPEEPRFYFSLASAYSKAGRRKEAAEARAAFLKLSQRDRSETQSTDSGADSGPTDSGGAGLERLDAKRQ